MKTFKIGLYSALLLAAAALSIFGGISQLVARAEAKIEPVTSAVIAGQVKAAKPHVVDLSDDKPVAPVPWLTPGQWSVIKTGRSQIICLYSDEQIAKNIKHGYVDGVTDGMLCIAKRPNDWIHMVDLPKTTQLKFDWDTRGLIDAEFTMRDGSKYFAHYFVKPMRPGETMSEVEMMAEFKDFGRLVTGASKIKISTMTIDGIVTQNFTNNMRD